MAHPKEFAEGLSIGIIMDGNGRWAKSRGLPRTAGHKRGAEVFSDIADYCDELGVSSVYFYAFSTENWKCPLEEIPVGKGRKLKEGSDLAVITIGPIGNVAARAITRAEADLGLSIAHYDLRFLKPLDEELLHEAGRKFQRILTIEDGIIKGGMGSAVLEFMADNEYKPTVKRIGIPNIFVEHGAVAELYQLCGMDEEGILTKIKEFIN